MSGRDRCAYIQVNESCFSDIGSNEFGSGLDGR